MNKITLYQQCKNVDEYCSKFLTIGKGYLIRFITDHTVELMGDDNQLHLTSAMNFKEYKSLVVEKAKRS